MRSLLLPLFVFTAFLASSQTLYWIGGPGNFNDPKHWSLTSNGQPANIVPNSNTDVVFDDNSGADNTIINIVGSSSVKSLFAANQSKKINLSGSSFDQLSVAGDFVLTRLFVPLFESKLSFQAAGSATNTVNLSGHTIPADVSFNGNYNLKFIKVTNSHSVTFKTGRYFLDHSSVTAGDIVFLQGTTQLDFQSGILLANSKLDIGKGTTLSGSGLRIIGDRNDASRFKIDPSVGLNPTVELLQLNAMACTITYSFTNASCNNACDGSITVNFSGCISGPYTLNFNTSATCLPANATNVNPPTYTLAAICASACAGQQVDIVVTNAGGFVTALTGQSLPQNPTPIQTSFSNAMPPTCFGLCNGSVTANIFGGSSPYTIFVNPSVPGATLSGVNPFTNTVIASLCAGLNTFSVVDNKGCAKTFTNVQPSLLPVASNSVLTNVACFGQCTGSLAISPTGGTAGYTVSFNPGGTFAVGAGGSASSASLCAGTAVTATITDVNSCSLVVSGNITQPSAVNIVNTSTNVSCFGLCDATASVTVSGGVAPYTYTWSPASSNTNVASGLCAGTQTVTIQNNAGQCTNTVAFTITQPASITITPTVANITCPGACTGSAGVTASGGAGAVTFTWASSSSTNISTSSSITAQCAGSYTVTGKDANGCTTQSVITITQPPSFTVSSSTQSITCFNTCTGGATVTVAGGTSPYTYTWSTISAPSTTVGVAGGTVTGSNLCSQNYTVSIKDASLCPVPAVTFSIAQSPSITPNITSTSLTCNNVCNGSINANPTNGVAPYTFTLITPTSSLTTNPPYNGLCAGTYTLKIKDQNCTQSFTVNLAQPNALVASIVSSSVTCFNVCNGNLSGSVLGGTPGYTLSWITPTTTVPGGVVGSVCANQVYTFSATDANGCVITKTASVNQPTSAITVTINQTAPTCNNFCNGSLNALVAGGTPGYTLSWSNGVTGNPNTNLCAGNYTLTVTDANGCTGTATANLASPPALTVTANTASPTCAGSNNGSATVTATGGTGIITYQLNAPLTTNTTGIFSGLGAGNHIVSATDANGCSQSINFTISNPPVLNGPITGILTSCNLCGGAATVTPSGGVPGYTVSWVNSGNVTVGTGTAISNLCIGNYTAITKDVNGCTTSATVSIVQTITVNVITGGTPIQCFGACTGSAVANPIGGTGTYSYSWTPTASTQTNQTAVNLCAGTYTVFVTDGLGCNASGTLTLTNPPQINVTSAQTNVACFSGTTGAISTTVTGGTGAITYSWSPGNQTTPSISGLAAGTYTLLVKDNNNCSKTLTYTITESNSITATFTTTQPTGCGISNGSICVTASGGSGAGYTYTWSPVAGAASCLSGLSAGVYSLTLADGAGCTATLSTILTNPSGPTLSIVSTSVACNSSATGGATVTASGLAPFTFTWSPNGTPFVNVGNQSMASALNSGTYAISVTQANNCVTTQTINIATAPAFTVNSTVTNPKCTGSCNGSITLVTTGGTPSGSAPNYTFAWSSPTITGVGTPTVTNLCAGSYTVNITDANSCVKTVTFNLVDPPSIVITSTATNVQCFNMCNGSIATSASGGTNPLSFNWLPVGTFTGATTATILNLCPNLYTVVVTDGNLCTATKTINITQPSQLTSTLTSINASCSNSCNATATLVAAGGVLGYNYSWTGSASTTSIATGICAGSYSGTVTDANGCSVIKTFTVTAPAPFTATLAVSNPLCNAACNGSITTTLAGAQGTVNFNWAPTGSGQNPTNLCPNNYTLTATDAAGCQLSSVATLTNPPAILANVTTTNPACNATCNGAALSTPVNGVGTITYSWTPAPPTTTTQSASGLCAGNYTLVVQDQNGCSDTQTFTLTSPPSLTVNPSSAPATCSVSNGSITLLVSGGTPTYNFSWSPSVSTSSTATGLAAGIYTVVITDFNNCTNTVNIPLSNSNGPSSAAIISSSISCFGQCTGAASVNPASIVGGSPGYTITWVPPAPSSSNPLTNLCTGTYTAQITDAQSCLLYTAVTISQPSSITINPNVTLPTCNGICNGSVSILTSGGTPGYNYTWTPAAPNSSAITNVCAGTLTVLIVDANNCPSTQTVNVPAVQNIAISSAATNNTCFGNCNGSATITSVSNGVPPFTETWSNGQSGAIASSLCNGTYTVMVTASNGCTNNFTTSITSPAQISATNAITSPSCNLCNGTSIATATGGVGPYTYSWTSGANTSTATNLCAGLYQVLVTDNVGCSQIINVPISNVPGITGETFTVTNEQCLGATNGAVTVQATGGVAPITYTWLTNPSVTNSIVTSLGAGVYFVQMMDVQGCIRTSSTTVGSSPGLTLSPFISPPACTGPPNGTINIVPSGGTGPYTYTWTPTGTTASSITNVGPGNYTVMVSDANGCTKTQAFTLSNFNNPTITYTQTNVSCAGACTGSIAALGTSTAGPVTYSWSAGGGGSTLNNICPGIVTLTVTSTNDGCIGLQSFTVTDNPAMQLSISNVQNVKCFGDCDGQVTLIPSGGILPYTFTWTTGSNTNPQFSLCAGSYSGTVIDALGCSITSTAVISGPAQPLAITNTVVNSSCSTVPDGVVTVNATGGTPTYTYNWTGPATFTSSSQNLNGVLAGNYTLNLIDANSCTIAVNVQVVPTITVDAQAGRDSTFCTGGSFILDGSASVGGAGGFTWTNITTSVNVGNTPTVNVTPGAGTNTFVLMVVSSSTNCIDFDTVVVNSLALPIVEAGPTFTIPVFSTVVIGGSPTSATGLTFTWSPGLTLDNPSNPNPTASNTVNTTYTVMVTDANGCVGSDTMQVLLYPEIVIPNGFSPNGDGKNDRWLLDNIYQFPDNVVEVYNRWGELLFRSEGYNVPFDGKYNGKDLPVGTYYYIINLNHPAYPKPYTGPLTIFR